MQTTLFTAVLLAGLLLTARKQPAIDLSLTLTNELKGFAILGVIFAHVGYYLVSDHQFLYPLSTVAGIIVKVFLFASGYGLVKSFTHKPQTITEFYRSRLPKLYIPMWIALVIACITRWAQGATLPSLQVLAFSFLGLFPVADIYQSLNSPLWYFTFIIANYLLFPVMFSAKHATLSAIIFGSVVGTIVFLPLPVSEGVLNLYRLHALAFPLGMIAASLHWSRLLSIRPWMRTSLFLVSTAVFVYAASHAHIGEGIWPETRASLIGTAGLLVAFLTKPLESRLLTFFGTYSYELYLLHWPILLADRWLFPHLPAALALVLWLGLLSLFSAGLQQFTKNPRRHDRSTA